MCVVGFIHVRLVQSGARRESFGYALEYLGAIGFIRGHPWSPCFDLRSFGSFGRVLVIVVFIGVRLIQSGAP